MSAIPSKSVRAERVRSIRQKLDQIGAAIEYIKANVSKLFEEGKESNDVRRAVGYLTCEGDDLHNLEEILDLCLEDISNLE